MNLRTSERFDYGIYNETGRKVPLTVHHSEMDLKQVEMEELKILDSLNFHLALNDVTELITDDECNGAVSTVTDLYDKYRSIHVVLRKEMDNYEQAYPDFEKMGTKVKDYLKSVKQILRKNMSKDKKSSCDSEIRTLEVEVEFLKKKIRRYNVAIEGNPLSLKDENVFDNYVAKMEGFINEIFSLSTRLKCICPDFDVRFGNDFDTAIFEIEQDIILATRGKRAVLQFRQDSQNVEDLGKARLEAVTNAENLKTEITFRFKSLSKKFDLDLDNLGDYQILELNQNKSFDLEFNSILEKVTELSSRFVAGGADVDRMINAVTKTRGKLSSKKETFFTKLQKIILDRDITTEKLKNGSDLMLELPKFSGYESQMDFFTFRTQFRKIIEQRVQKKHWADYLKHNYLCGQALLLVKNETDYEKIWDRLSESFGNPRVLLQNKLSCIDKIGGLPPNNKNEEKVVNALATLTNVMKDLSTLATEHDIEGQLYEGGGLEKVFLILGESRHRRFRTQSLGHTYSKKQQWQSLKEFLEKELQVNEMLLLDRKSAQLMGFQLDKRKSDPPKKFPPASAHPSVVSDKQCHVCDKTGHTKIITAKGNEILPYYLCETFVKMSPAERYSILDQKNFCTVCLFPGAVRGPNHKCHYTNFCCPAHDQNNKIHVLLCETHKKNFKNLEILEKFKERFLIKCKVTLPKFVNSLALFSCAVGFLSPTEPGDKVGKFTGIPDIIYPAIFQLQTIVITGEDDNGNVVTISLNLFFDNGASDCIIRKSAIEKLNAIGRADQVSSEPLELEGVAGNVTVCDDGIWRIILPLYNGENAIFSGLCLPKITADFPTYTLTDVVTDVRGKCEEIGGQKLVSTIPEFPTVVGGGTDILLGSKYKRYFPKEVYELEDGLSILRSIFASADGTRGVFNGPHKGFLSAKNGTHFSTAAAYYTPAVNEYHRMKRLEMSVPLLGEKPTLTGDDIDEPICCDNADPDHLNEEIPCMSVSVCLAEKVTPKSVRFDCLATKRTPKKVKIFEEIEAAGTDVTYRCGNCRNCKDCLKGPILEAISLKDEAEQNLIEKCVDVDIKLRITMARLPFILNPDTHLVNNEHVALKVFNSQLRILNDRPDDKKSVLDFEQKLQDMKCVDYVSNLDEEIRNIILQHKIKYFISWRPVWSVSVTTPCRMVFDASMSTKGACSLNSILAKGCNSLNNLQGITIRWAMHRHAFHTDVQKMYNKVLLHPSYWRYQLYLFSPELNIDDTPQWKVIMTLIYGVRPSGGLAECGLRKTVELCKTDFPLAYGPIMYDTYMDDCVSGTDSWDESMRVMDQIENAVNCGGFTLKGFTISGEDPPAHLSLDGKSIPVFGVKWFSKGDFCKLNPGKANFNKKVRGRKALINEGVIPDILTLRHCVGRVSEVFDPRGLVAALLAGFKLDINTLHQFCKGWDDPIPSELKELWRSNFDIIEEIGNIEFHRAVVPHDAVSLELETIDTADASEHLVCSAIYGRFLRKDGTYSCQLLFARSKVIHDTTIPRAELVAAVLNASTGHLVRISLKDFYKTGWHVTDSQVTLMWINNTKAALKPYVRNRVVEIKRLTEQDKWFYTKSENMIADLGTRKGVTIEQVSPGSPWIDGLPWMRDREENFPLISADALVLSAKEKAEMNNEKVCEPELPKQAMSAFNSVPKDVGERYKFSQYLVNPCRFRFRKVIRILGLVFLFIRKVSVKRMERLQKNPSFLETGYDDGSKDQYVVNNVHIDNVEKVVAVLLTNTELCAAKAYYFRKATQEITKFVDPKRYTDISVLKDGILYFSSRILITQKVDGRFSFTDAALDLSEATFCVPLTDNHSPLAYALVLETHWYDPDISHSGVESTLRYAQNTAYIIGGRELVKRVRKGCVKCRLLHKQGLKIAMGPIPDENLKIAPVFYYCQTDICGPYNAFSPANKRATLKIYFVVFVCTVTGAVDCRVMEDYTTESFILAFSRFSCRFGYPKMMMPDEGSQLVKGCQDMVLSYTDLCNKLSVEYGVDFKTCPVGAHYVHGKVERKIQQIKRSLEKTFDKSRLSILQWETMGQQVSNSINNLPIGIGNKVESLDTLDILTPNRLILGRNNCRGPVSPLALTDDYRGIIESNKNIYESWFKEWLVNYVPTLVRQPKWFVSERNIRVGDVVLFSKSDKEFEKVYQYGIVLTTFESKDGLIRVVEVQYQNFKENVKRTTKRCVRELVVIHPVDEIGIQAELDDFAAQSE